MLSKILNIEMLRGGFFLLMSCFLIGCLKSSSELDRSQIIPSGNKIRRGRRLYQKICIKCHYPKDIRERNGEEWKKIIAKKIKKDPLMMTEQQTEYILYFLTYGSGGATSIFSAAGPGEPFAMEQTLDSKSK
jgi:hypothetical protein